MTTVIIAQIGVLGLLLLLSAFFSSSESAFFSLNPLQVRRMKAEHPKIGRQIKTILESPRGLLSTILIGNTVVNVLLAGTGFAVAEQLWPGKGELISIVVITLLVLVFGEIGPKRVALLWAERVAIIYAPVITVSMRIVTPLRILLEGMTKLMGPLFTSRSHILTGDEFKSVIDLSGEDGVLDEEESDMVRAIIRLEDLHASDVMCPRVDLEGLDLKDDHATFVDAALRTDARQLLLYDGGRDNPVGFLDVRRFLLDPKHDIESARIPSLFVPETCALDRLLAQFQAENQGVAIVVDEYGGTAGIVTRGDILEEIVGEIDNETDVHKSLLERLGEHRWLVDGHMSLEELNHRLGLKLEAEGVDRLSGWILTHAERVPGYGDTVEAQGFRATVRGIRRHRITLVALERLEQQP